MMILLNLSVQIEKLYPDMPFSRCVNRWAITRCIHQYVRSLRARDCSLLQAAREEGVDLDSESVRQELEA
jgi:hypothetical protein